MADFRALLEKKVDQAEKPKPVPPGSYRATVKGHRFDESSQKKTPYVQYEIGLISPEADVDLEAFEEFGGLAKLPNRSQRLDFYLTDDALYRLREFLEDTMQINCEGRAFGETIPEADGKELIVTVAHKPSQDGKDMYVNITGHAAAPQ